MLTWIGEELKKIRKLLWIIGIEKVRWGWHRLWRGPHRRPKSKKGSLIREDDGVHVALCCCRHCYNYSSCEPAMGSGPGRRGWWLFRSKVRCPVEVVRHSRDLLSYVLQDREAHSNNRDPKREQKVVCHFISCSYMSLFAVQSNFLLNKL